MDLKLLIRTGLIVVIITFLNFLLDFTFGLTNSFAHYGWQTISNLLIFILLGYYIIHSNLAGIGLSLLVFSIYYIIGYLNLIIESLIFNLADFKGILNSAPRSLILALIIAPATVYIFGKWSDKTEKNEFSSRPVTSWIWRIAVGDILYLVFYITAGLTLINIYPELTKFYNEKTPPPPELIFGTQLIRGLIFISIAILICRTVNLSLFKKAVLTGLIFSIIGGIAPLILPSAEMPSYIRLGHGFEVGISNFLYGLILGYLFSQKLIN
jgi:hypothetical protein